MPAPIAVLVIAEHPMIGSLLGSLVELTGHRPLFPAADRTPAFELGRLRPTLVLLDCDHTAATDERIYARAAEVGSRVLIFSSSQGRRETERVAEERGVRPLVLPIGYNAFASAVAEALAV